MFDIAIDYKTAIFPSAPSLIGYPITRQWLD
jgi:hypothetical protein